jgi:hypothetical protein
MAMSQSPWITTLHFAFQNRDHLFLVMEFISVRVCRVHLCAYVCVCVCLCVYTCT